VFNKTNALLFLLLTILVALAFSLLPRIPQSQTYHSFADQRSLFGIPNFGDVVSNIPFGVIGIWGMLFLLRSNSGPSTICFRDSRERWPYILLFIGLFLTAFGSSYYHLSPSNARLVWDRLPMTIVFMSMVAAIIAEHVSGRVGLWSLPILLLVGTGSVLQWYSSEAAGLGDLRFYAAVQTYSALVLLLALALPKRYTRKQDLAAVLGFYALAKILESLDKPIFAMGQIVSGHTLKHLAAAAAGYWILRMLQKRRPADIPSVVSLTGGA
jgi:hypothetical protein